MEVSNTRKPISLEQWLTKSSPSPVSEKMTGIRQPITITPEKQTRWLIKEGTPPQYTERQKAYFKIRAKLFNPDPSVEFSSFLIRDVLEARGKEIDEAAGKAPLKSATDRNGYTLGSLKVMNSLALQELNGTLNSENHVLKRQLELITNEEESRIRQKADNLARLGTIIDEDTGNLIFQKPKEYEITGAQKMKENFLKGKERLQEFASKL